MPQLFYPWKKKKNPGTNYTGGQVGYRTHLCCFGEMKISRPYGAALRILNIFNVCATEQ
jgi:hypothetical protein